MKIILVGGGKVGTALARQLSEEDHNVTIVDTNKARVEHLTESYDVLGIVGNGSSITTLAEAGIEDADVFIAVTGSDELNLLCCMFAKKAGHCHAIARVRNPSYSHELDFIKKQIGISAIINPEMAAAKEISHLLRFPGASKIDTFADGRVRLIKFALTAEQGLDGVAIREIPTRLKSDILVCAVERDGGVIIPNGNFVPREGDKLYMVGTKSELQKMLRAMGRTQQRVKTVSLLGGSRIAMYLTWELAVSNTKVCIVEQKHDKCLQLAAQLPTAMIIEGDGTEEELLTEALLGAENTGRDVRLFMNRMEHDDYRSVPELYQAGCPECGAPLQNDEVWLKRGNTGYFTRAVCPYCGHWYLRFKLSRRDGLHWSFARCIDPATPEYDARWDKQKAALLERMKRKQERNIKE